MQGKACLCSFTSKSQFVAITFLTLYAKLLPKLDISAVAENMKILTALF